MKFAMLGVAFVALALTVPGASAQEWKNSPEAQALYEAAKQEGKVVLCGPHAKDVNWVPEAFAAVFPGSQVEVLGDNNIATKAITEARSGRHSVDVLLNSLAVGVPLHERGLSPKTIGRSSALANKSMGLMSDGHQIAYSLVYNRPGASDRAS